MISASSNWNKVSGIYPKYINIFRATVIISVFCVICTPWNIIKNAAGLLAFLSGYSCLMGPLAGVMVSDFYLIKKRKLNIHELYKDHGIYHYSNGWNWRAYAAFCVGFIPLIPGFAKSISPTLNVGGAWKVRCPPTPNYIRKVIGANTQLIRSTLLPGFTASHLRS